MNETVTLFTTSVYPLRDPELSETQAEFITPEGRYYVDAEVFVANMHDLLHSDEVTLLLSDPGFTATDGAHVLINMTDMAIGSLLMEASVNLPDQPDPRG